MRTFIKAQSVLVAGSAVDFLLCFCLVQFFNCWYLPANVLGNITGAWLQFTLSRGWVFNAAADKLAPQFVKFILMWCGEIIISSVGVFLLTTKFHIPFLLSKLMISVVAGPTYTYLLSKQFVFRHGSECV